MRSIFPGVQDASAPAQKQFEQMARLDRIARHVARQSCLGVLDVYEVDRAAGIYEHIGPEDFHSPYSAERHAATAMLLWLMELPLRPICRDECVRPGVQAQPQTRRV